MAQALYRKYRSRSLDEIIGQTHVTEVLKNALEKGRVSHAYLLTGPKGTGKTSVARIMAHEINNLPYSNDGHLDIIEVDAASNNGVDDVRDLREKVSIVPVSASKKIYIIDEVHMLSKPAFNALLKTLEEPPEHVVFILATTEVHKLPDTILSRTQRFHFRLAEEEEMTRHLKAIAKKEKITIDDPALALISFRARGSFRDGISLLDQLSSLSEGNITAEMVEQTLGLAGTKAIETLAEAVMATNLKKAIDLLGELEKAGVSPVVLSEQLGSYLRRFVVTRPDMIALIEELIDVARSYDPALKLLAIVATAASLETDKPAPRSQALKVTETAPIISASPPQKDRKSLARAKSAEAPTKLEWKEVLDFVRTHHVVLYGVLQRAEANMKGDTLNLHFTYSLHRKKLEDGRYRQLLADSLISLYKEAPSITITSGRRPPNDEQTASVAAIMGGGEEVSIEI